MLLPQSPQTSHIKLQERRGEPKNGGPPSRAGGVLLERSQVKGQVRVCRSHIIASHTKVLMLLQEEADEMEGVREGWEVVKEQGEGAGLGWWCWWWTALETLLFQTQRCITWPGAFFRGAGRSGV